jgi:hypothetical protein
MTEAFTRMPIAIRILFLTAGWLLPLAWTILWGVFRGTYAHGGFGWWQQVHHGGLVGLGAFALWLHWRQGGPLQLREMAALAAGSASLLLLVTWLSFQAGLAVHEPPASVSGFLFDEP